MNIGRAVAAAAALAVATAPPAAAQQPPQRITFEQAVDIALERNTSLRLAQNSAEQAGISVGQQKRAFLPGLQVSTSGTQSMGRAFNQDVGQIINTSTRSFNAGASASVTLFDGMRNFANLKAAELLADASGLSLERTRETVALAVATNFISLIEATEQALVRTESLAAQEMEEQQIQVFVDAGSRPIADLYQQQANVAAARAALVEAHRTMERARTDIMETLQLDPLANYEFVAPELVDIGDSVPEDLDALIVRTLANRADLDAQLARVSAAEQDVRAAEGAYWPSVSMSAGYNTGATSASDVAFREQLDERRGGSVGLSVSIPLFDRGVRSAQTQQARIAVENAEIALEQQRTQSALEVRRAWVDYGAAAEQVNAAEAQLAAAELALDAVTERYRVGAATQVEIAQARATQVQAASALVSNRYALLLQRTLLAYYVGDLDPDRARI